MILFELLATLGLDTTSFTQQADAAVAEGESAAQSVSQSFEQIQEEASEADDQLEELETKSKGTSAIVEGLIDATQEVVKKTIEQIIEFGKQSIEAAAATGSELAVAFNEAKDNFDTTAEALKLKVGNVLLPLTTGFYNLASSIMGVTDTERLTLLFAELEEYEFTNIENLKSSLDGIFGLFEQADAVETGNVADMTAGLQSQAEYWTEYADTLENLKKRNIDPQFLADIADGTVQSLETLKALEAADTTELKNLMAAYEAVEETKEAAAQGLNDIQIAVDEDLLAMTESVEELVAGMNQEEAAKANAMLTGQGVVDGLAAMSPAISSWVNYINSELSRIGNVQIREAVEGTSGTHATDGGAQTGGNYGRFFASGLSYVPYDGYRAELHRGEGVLTRQQNENYQSGRSSSADNSAVVQEIRDLKTAILSMQLVMDKTTVGHLVAPTVSEDIAREAGVFG